MQEIEDIITITSEYKRWGYKELREAMGRLLKYRQSQAIVREVKCELFGAKINELSGKALYV